MCFLNFAHRLQKVSHNAKLNTGASAQMLHRIKRAPHKSAQINHVNKAPHLCTEISRKQSIKKNNTRAEREKERDFVRAPPENEHASD
jgi:hypothetical protein